LQIQNGVLSPSAAPFAMTLIYWSRLLHVLDSAKKPLSKSLSAANEQLAPVFSGQLSAS